MLFQQWYQALPAKKAAALLMPQSRWSIHRPLLHALPPLLNSFFHPHLPSVIPCPQNDYRPLQLSAGSAVTAHTHAMNISHWHVRSSPKKQPQGNEGENRSSSQPAVVAADHSHSPR